MTNQTYVRQSLELNIFFLRVLKEHGLFLAISFLPKYQDEINEASKFNTIYNTLLRSAVELGTGVVDFKSDLITEHTLDAEKKTESLTGFKIDNALTELELKTPKPGTTFDVNLVDKVRSLNNRAATLTKNFIRYKTKILNALNSCQLLSSNFHLLIDHIRREAIYFVELLSILEKGSKMENEIQRILEEEYLWNQLMQEHSEFVRGYLDPTEINLINIADDFSKKYKELNQKIQDLRNNKFTNLLNESQKLTKEIKKFKDQGTVGLINCKIKAIVAPLLGDHILREANHYLYLIEKFKKAGTLS